MEKTQREYYLNEQMKAIQKELGESEDGTDELADIAERIKKVRLSKEAREKATAELKKLKNMSQMSAEATVVRNYLDWLLGIPWKKKSKVKKDLSLAQQILDRDHHGLRESQGENSRVPSSSKKDRKSEGPHPLLGGSAWRG